MLPHSNAKLNYTRPVKCDFKKMTTYLEHLISKQYTEGNSFISEDFALEIIYYMYDAMRTLW